MTTDTIKSIATGLITIPSRPIHHEALLDSAFTSALALYSSLRPLMLCATFAATGARGSDEQGDYTEFANVPLTSGIMFASMLTVSGDQYKHRITAATVSGATVRLYAKLSGTVTLAIWRPAAHDSTLITWPAHHEAVIALITASFYLNGVSLSDPDTRHAEMLQAVAASYFGRASSTLNQLNQS